MTLKSWVKHGLNLIITIAVYLAILFPFKMLWTFMPHVTEVRVAAFVPPVAGLLFGIPGALGVFFGNFIGDVASGDVLISAFIGSSVNFLFAYVPHKLWYAYAVKGTSLALGNAKSIVKYVVIVLFSSAMTAALLALLVEFLGYSPANVTAPLFFFNCFDFSLMLGIPVLLLLSRFKLNLSIPKPKEKNTFLKRFFILDFALAAAVLSSVIYVLVALGGGQANSRAALILLCVCLPLCAAYCFRPAASASEKYAPKPVNSIAPMITKMFLLIITAAIVTATVIDIFYIQRDETYDIEFWRHIYISIALTINVLFLLTVLSLVYIERYITNPVLRLTEAVDDFIKSDKNQLRSFDGIKGQEQSADEIQTLSASFKSMVSDINNYLETFKRNTVEKERDDAEMSIAKQIQSGILPTAIPVFDDTDFDMFAYLAPAKRVGGDFYDYFMIDDCNLAIAVADVSGKSIPAAMFMMAAKTLIKNAAQNCLSPATILNKANAELCGMNEAGMFATVWLGILNILSGRLVYCNAGHDYPFIKQNGKFGLLKTVPQLPLAVMDNTAYKEYELFLRPDEGVLLYTDGVTEAQDADCELFTDERVLNILNTPSNLNAAAEPIIQSVNSALTDFRAGSAQNDDITMLAFGFFKRTNLKSITLNADVDLLDSLVEFAFSVLDDIQYSQKFEHNLTLVLEELFVNIASYAYPSDAIDKTVDIACGVVGENGEQVFFIEFCDGGIEFNPFEQAAPDIGSSLDERQVGGLGVYLVKRLADTYAYRREDKRNIVTVKMGLA